MTAGVAALASGRGRVLPAPRLAALCAVAHTEGVGVLEARARRFPFIGGDTDAAATGASLLDSSVPRAVHCAHKAPTFLFWWQFS